MQGPVESYFDIITRAAICAENKICFDLA